MALPEAYLHCLKNRFLQAPYAISLFCLPAVTPVFPQNPSARKIRPCPAKRLPTFGCPLERKFPFSLNEREATTLKWNFLQEGSVNGQEKAGFCFSRFRFTGLYGTTGKKRKGKAGLVPCFFLMFSVKPVFSRVVGHQSVNWQGKRQEKCQTCLLLSKDEAARHFSSCVKDPVYFAMLWPTVICCGIR